MREIKLQGWVEEYRLMGRIHAINFDENEIQIEFDVDEKPFYTGEFKDVKIRQFTGLLDKNGKEIYEGDIVKFEYYDEMVSDDNDIQEYSEDAQIAEVQSKGIIKGDFEECQIWLIDWAMDSDYIFEIIGNIYENPELLK